MTKYIIPTLIFLTLFACKSGSDDKDKATPEVDNDSINRTEIQGDGFSDTLEDSEADTIEDDVKYEDPEVQEAHEKIVKEYGVQWDFCTCVKKNDSINKAMMEDDISDEDFDLLFERSDFIDSKCKGLLIQPNATPEQRAKHEKKVKDCLREG